MKMGPQDTVWITGAAGRMGQAIEHFLDHSRYKVMTSDIEIDVSNLHEVLNFAESYRPDFVINCAALASRTEADENPDKAYKVNALGARNLAIASNSLQELPLQKNQGILENIIYLGLNRKTEEIITRVEKKKRI